MHQRRSLLAAALVAGKARAATVLAAAVLAAGTAPTDARAHEIPERVAIVAFVQPDSASSTLRVLLRVPLEAMRDIEVPLTATGALDLVRVRALLPDLAALWVAGYLGVFEDGQRLAFGNGRVAATRISLPSDRSFGAYATALAHMRGEGPPTGTEIPWNQAMLDILLEYPITSASARFAIEPALAHLGVRTTSVLRLQLPDADERILIYEGNPGRVELDPGFLHAAARFVRAGFFHILGGIDHLLFVLCLVLPVRRWRPLVTIVTAFTVAHSLTLGAAALGFAPGALWFPPLVEAAIALSIVYLAIENMLLSEERLEQRWMMAFGFGLIHGFGFSFALGEQLQFAGRHLVTSLAAFNIGVELGQLLVLAAAVPVLMLVRRYVGRTAVEIARGAPALDARSLDARSLDAPSRGSTAVTILGSAIIAHSAWHWMSERFSALGEYRAGFVWPQFDAVFVLGVLRAGLLLAIAIAVGLGFQQILRMLQRSSRVLFLLVTLTAATARAQEPTPRDSAGANPSATHGAQSLSTADGVYTLDQARRGKDVFALACQSCHSPTLHAGAPFRNKWFGRPLSELFGYLRREMPKTEPGMLTNEDYALVTAYLLRINGMPTGRTPLAADSAALQHITLDSVPKRENRTPTEERP